MRKITTREQYDETKTLVEQLIVDATRLGMLEPDMENEYTLKISELSKLMADYEDEFLKLFPLKELSPKKSNDYHRIFNYSYSDAVCCS